MNEMDRQGDETVSDYVMRIGNWLDDEEEEKDDDDMQRVEIYAIHRDLRGYWQWELTIGDKVGSGFIGEKYFYVTDPTGDGDVSVLISLSPNPTNERESEWAKVYTTHLLCRTKDLDEIAKNLSIVFSMGLIPVPQHVSTPPRDLLLLGATPHDKMAWSEP